MWFLILWICCGFASILLGWIVQKLKDPTFTFAIYKEVITPTVFACIYFGPFLLGIGIFYFFKNILKYKSKGQKFLEKLES
jgi:hypothetical protein